METLDDEEAEEAENNMNRDLEIASILEDEAIPFSLEYFLGIAEKDEDMEDDEGDEIRIRT